MSKIGPIQRDGEFLYALQQTGTRRGEPVMENAFAFSVAGRASEGERLKFARLFVAAPELLAALANLLNAFGGHADKKLCGHLFECACPFELAQKAIAKAEPTPDTFTDADRMHDQAADVAAENEEFE